jgi:hypothetical protein
MRLSLERSTFVILGSWNFAIFIAEGWLAERVGAPIDEPDLGIAGGRPVFRYRFRDMTLSVAEGQLILAPDGQEGGSHQRCYDVAMRLLNDLPATPVTAVGINVCFDVSEPPDRLGGLLAVEDEHDLGTQGLRPLARTYGRRFQSDRCVINLSIAQAVAVEGLRLDFNHHFDVDPKTALAARGVLDGQLPEVLADSRRIARAVYNLEEDA